MACKYKWNGEWYTREQLENLQNSNTPEFDDLYEANITDGIRPNYEAYVSYKENLIDQLQNRLNKVKKQKKDFSTDLNYVKKLSQLENDINIRINGSEELGILGLVNEVAQLLKEPPISKLDFYVEKDFQRLETLASSNNEEDLDEARGIVRFYKALGTFNVNDDHPLLERQQIYDDKGNFILPDDIKDAFDSYYNKAQEYENIISKKESDKLTDTVNNLSKINKIFGDEKLSYEKIFHKEGGLKDTSWVDMFVMDITNGIFSDNGIIPQVGQNILQNAYESKLVYSKSIEDRINNVQRDLEKELSTIENGKYRLENVGILGVKGVSYEIFRAKNKNGQFRDNITQRFSPEFMEAKSSMFKKLDENIKKAIEEENPSIKAGLFAQAYQERNDWYKKNTIVLTPSMIPEIINNPDFSQFSGAFETDKSERYSAHLKTILGSQGYEEEVNKQIKLLKDYKVALEVFTDNILLDYDTDVIDNLPIEARNKVESWVKRNDPFTFTKHYNESIPVTKGKLTINPTMAYNYSIPRKKKVKLVVSEQGRKIQPTDVDTDYYDERFSTIESNPTLKEFHNILIEVTQTMYDTIPSELREKLSPTSIPALRKNIAEILFDSNIPLLERIVKAAKELYDLIRGKFGINVQESFSYAKVDPITGKPEYKVNDSFFKTNSKEINRRYEIELLRFKQSMGISLISDLSARNSYKISELSEGAVSVLEDNTGMKINQIKDIFGENILPLKILRDGITDQVVKSNSFDLPKILKLYSHLTQEYAARQEVLPILKIIKSHYEDIKKPATSNTGKSIKNVSVKEEDGEASRSTNTRFEGERQRANRQFNSWFERAVLGNFASKSEFGDDTIKRGGKLGLLTGNEKIDSLTSKLQTTVTGKILDTDEKILRNKLPNLITELEKQIPNLKDEAKKKAINQLNRLQNIEKNLGKDFSATATLDAIFSFIRFKGLGYNLSSSVTNFLEGQIGNFTIAATGDYFRPENIYRANDIVKGSFLKNTTFGKIATPGANKASVLMNRYRVLQDASNELQKASTKTTFSKFNKLAPYELTQRTEYLNQTPLMIAVLLDEKITSKEGEVSNVWDAMNPDGSLKEEFQTEENINNWENANGDNYNDFSSKLTKAIVNTHGDYDQLRGNMASEYISGKAILMFKRWMARQFYQRFGKEQIDLEAEIGDAKGRYRSHTQVSGAVHGGIIGFAGLSLLGAGPLGLLIGGTAGLVGAKFYGANTELGFLKELSIVSKELLLNVVRIPTNTITGKATIRNINLNEIANSKSISERDLKNLQANIVDMSIALAWIGLLLFSKALLWDDDDEETSARRKAHNLLANRFMQLAGQSSQYINPVDTWKNTVGDLPALRFFNDVGKTATKAQNFLEGKDIIQAGPNAGESALLNQSRKTFMPGVLKSGFGFESQMERQFEISPFDTWFYGNERQAKSTVRRIRAKYRNSLPDNLSKKETLKAVNKKYRSKKKGETYTQLLENYNKVK